jgi:hypothetical protein
MPHTQTLSSASEAERSLSGEPEHVREETLRVLNGYFRSESEHVASDTETGMVAHSAPIGFQAQPANVDALELLGQEMQRTSMRLQVTHRQEFEDLMRDLGPEPADIINGLHQIFRSFLSPRELTWEKIATFFAFSYFVLSKIIQRGVAMVRDAASSFLSSVTSAIMDSMSSHNVFQWIATQGGWASNRDAVLAEIQVAEAVSIEPPSGAWYQRITRSQSFNSFLLGGAAVVATTAVVTGVVLYKR